MTISSFGTQRKGMVDIVDSRVQLPPLEMKTHRPRETHSWPRVTQQVRHCISRPRFGALSIDLWSSRFESALLSHVLGRASGVRWLAELSSVAE